ncbi:MAG: TetR/AcrR family transcriptional regulator [Treponemataceae bacterium]|nr:TetR/AcrR family transcriptional regulator [Spirochaetales bacterium]MDY6031620.1 TetR/AcrR family transcriptional regulator [Treponemataceae bacterium]
MAAVVEHEARRRMILDKALALFIDEGYEDVTFQKIADRCGITRTTLYIYFSNKRDIFMYSIKQLGETLEDALNSIIDNESLSMADRLKGVMMSVYNCCLEHRQLFSVLLMYLLQIQKTGVNTEEKVRRRTLRLRHLLSTILIEGIEKEEFKKVDVKATNEVFYGLIESLIYRLAILNQTDLPDFERMIDFTISGIRAN